MDKKNILIEIAKSMHKVCKKQSQHKDVIEDILDPNMVPEADNDKIPPQKTSVMNKNKLKKYVEKKKKIKKMD